MDRSGFDPVGEVVMDDRGSGRVLLDEKALFRKIILSEWLFAFIIVLGMVGIGFGVFGVSGGGSERTMSAAEKASIETLQDLVVENGKVIAESVRLLNAVKDYRVQKVREEVEEGAKLLEQLDKGFGEPLEPPDSAKGR